MRREGSSRKGHLDLSITVGNYSSFWGSSLNMRLMKSETTHIVRVFPTLHTPTPALEKADSVRSASAPTWLNFLPSQYMEYSTPYWAFACLLPPSQSVCLIRGIYRSPGFFFSRTNLSSFLSSLMCTEFSFVFPFKVQSGQMQ